MQRGDPFDDHRLVQARHAIEVRTLAGAIEPASAERTPG
jgi:hypothetical protein